MAKHHKYEIINDRMSADDIAKIVCGDLTDNFKLTMRRKFDKAVRGMTESEYNGSVVIATVSVIGQSGQKYRIVLHHITMPDGTITDTLAILVFVVIHTGYDIVYMTLSADEEVESILDCTVENISINRYTDHVVHRYNERHGGKHYGERGFIDMVIRNFNFEPHVYGDNRLMARISSGALVGKVVNGKNCFNSYYTEEMILSKKPLRELYNKCDVNTSATIYCKAYHIQTLLTSYDHGHINITELIEKINTITENVTDEFYEQSGITRDFLNSEIQRRIVGTDAIRSACSDRSSLHQKQQKILCMESIVPRIQSGVPTIQRFSSFRGFQNRQT